MAQLTPTRVTAADTGKAVQMNPVTGTDTFPLDNADSRTTLLLRNDSAKAATFVLKAGDGLLAPKGDVSIPVAAGALVAVPMSRVDSARVKTLSGPQRDTVSLTASAAGGGVEGLSAAVLSVK